LLYGNLRMPTGEVLARGNPIADKSIEEMAV
jgi:hypothetical protein